MLLPAGLVCVAADALDTDRKISQFGHTAWRIQDGTFEGVPTAIAQTTDGYLWFGTPDGLLRFDGAQFVSWSAPDGQRLPRSDIHALLGTSDGSLWIGTGRGLARWKNGELITYPGTGDWVNAIVEERAGVVWIGRSQIEDGKGPLCRITDKTVECFGEAEGVGIDAATRLVEDNSGNFWIGGTAGLCRWKPGSSQTYFAKQLKESHVLIGVEALAAEKNGELWAGIERSGTSLELQHYLQGEWSGTKLPGLSGTESDISTMYVDRDGTLWIGTGDKGIYRVRGKSVDHFGSTDGLSSDAVARFFEDSEGTLWVATSKGVDSFRDLRVASFSIREGLTADSVSTVLAGRDGELWIGNSGALDVLRGDTFSAIRERHGLPGRNVTTMLEDRAGRLWVGVDGGLAIYEGGNFRSVHLQDGSATGTVFALTEDSAGRVWALAGRKLLRIENSGGEIHVREETTSPEIAAAFAMAADTSGRIWLGLSYGDMVRMQNGKMEIFPGDKGGKPSQIRSLFVDSDGSVLAATLQGLVRWKDGQRKLLGTRNGLPCDEIYAMVKDQGDGIWLYTKCGVVEVGEAEIKKWWEQPYYRVTARTFDIFDGARPGLTPLQPQSARSTDGRLWFANDTILQMIDPRRMAGNVVVPPVHIEGVVADGKNYLPQDGLQLPALTRDLRIDYAALSYAVPKKVRYRYMLEGHDHTWQEPENRRQAFYSDLRPGKYRFRVIASNNDGVWNEAGAALNFEQLPAFYQSGWFRGLCALAVLGVAWIFYLLRVRQMRLQIQSELEARLGERERIARELHDTLLQSIQGLILRFQAAAEKIPASEPSRVMMEKALDRADQVMVEGRERVRDLRTTGERGDDLTQAFYEMGQELAQDGVEFRVIVEGAARDIHPVVRDEIYWIGHEALANSFQHAHAKHIEIEMTFDPRELRVRFRDDGRGVASDILQAGGRQGHWGMPGMRERAHKIGAKIAMWSRPEAGTEVELRIPSAVAYRSNKRNSLWRLLRAGMRDGVQ